MQTVIAHPQNKAQQAAITAVLDALNVPYEVGSEKRPHPDKNTEGQPMGFLELNGTAKGLWKSQAEIDQHLEDLREW